MLAGKSALMRTHPGYVRQLNTYLGLSKLPRGCLLFEEKGLGGQKAYWLLFDEELFEDTLAVARRAAPYLRAKQGAPVPDDRTPEHKGDEVCKTCERRSLCLELSRGEVSFDEAKATAEELRG